MPRILLSAAALLAATLTWTATASASQALDAQPTAVSFPDYGIHNGNGGTQTVTFSDPLGAPTAISSVAINGSGATQFAIASDGCTGFSFSNPGDQCALSVFFDPSAVGPHLASLDVADSSGLTSVPLSGSGVTGGLMSDPGSVDFSPAPYYYGPQQQGFQLRNPDSNWATQASSATITGPDAARFSIAYGDDCFTRLFFASNSCGLGVAFDPPGPGTFDAQLEVASDASDSPLIIPLSATALSGPRVVVSPDPIDFGEVSIGQEATQAVTFANEGDAPMQAQQLLFITGRPDIFFLTGDTCSGQIVAPGQSCSVVAHFKPTSAGERDASLFLITGNQSPPVSNIGVSGTGVAPAPPAPAPGGAAVPGGAANLIGAVAAGSELGCRPVGYATDTSFTYRWLRDGVFVAGRTGADIPVEDDDVGARFACEITATNSAGSQTARSAQSAPVAPLDLARQSGAFTDERTCRTVRAPRALRVGGRSVAVRAGDPSLPWAPLTLRAKSAFTVTIDGVRVGRGTRVVVDPRALARFGDGNHTLRLSTGSSSAQSPITLAACRLALDVDGGPRRSTTVAVSARAGMGSLRVTLPGSLRSGARGRAVGKAFIKTAGYPARVFSLVGPRTTSNGVTVTIRSGTISVTGLPAQTGVVRLRLNAEVLSGRSGTASVRSILRGDDVATRASTPVSWVR